MKCFVKLCQSNAITASANVTESKALFDWFLYRKKIAAKEHNEVHIVHCSITCQAIICKALRAPPLDARFYWSPPFMIGLFRGVFIMCVRSLTIVLLLIGFSSAVCGILDSCSLLGWIIAMHTLVWLLKGGTEKYGQLIIKILRATVRQYLSDCEHLGCKLSCFSFRNYRSSKLFVQNLQNTLIGQMDNLLTTKTIQKSLMPDSSLR